MATVSVTADNTRIDALDSLTNITDIGGGAGSTLEPDFVYQGTNSVSRKVSTSTRGFALTPASTTDISSTGTYQTVIFKFIATNKDALENRTTPGLQIRIGSSATDYYEYDLEGADTYPIKGGWLIRPIDPNVSAYRDRTGGSPSLSAADYYGIQADFTATSKSENLAMDAVDVGAGLTLTGGDGADTDGVFDDFVSHDEGTGGNRYGYVTTLEGILFVYGMLTIGSSTATVFNDSGVTVVFPDGLFDTGFSGITTDLSNATTDVDIVGCNFLGRGTETTVDTRPDFTATGTSGDLLVDGTLINNFRNITLTSACSLDNSTIVSSEALTQSSALIDNCVVDSPTVASGVAFLTSNDPSKITDCAFTSGGSGHAIEISSTGTYSFTGNTFSGYGTGGSNDAAVYNNSGGAVTLNILGGGDTPTVRNGTGSSTTVNNTVAVKVTCVDSGGTAIQNARVFLEADTGGSLPAGDTATITRSGTTATVSHTGHGMANNDLVVIRGATQQEYNGVFTISNVSTNAYDYTVSGSPATPATGTITASAVIINELTNVSGLADNTGFNFASNQPVKGKARKSTSAPYYKSSPITGTITSAGFDSTITMIGDG